MIVRIGLAASAAAAIAWFAVGLGASQQEARAIELATPRDGRVPTGAQIAQARRLLRDARNHNADTAPLLLEAQLDVFAAQPRLALPLLEEVVQREPENADAWRLLARAAATIDPARAAAAQARFEALSPPVPE